MSVTRRQMLGTSALTGIGVLAASTGLAGPANAGTAATRTAGVAERDGSTRPLFPPLVDADETLLALPDGFSYEIVAVSGQTEIHDGTGRIIGKTPERPDGTRSGVAPRGKIRLIQNHEAGPGAVFPVPLVAGTVYDPGALGGGCTVIETSRTGVRQSQWVGLSGTVRNCAGGITPWGSWLTCEETEATAGTGTLEQDHGYVFEVFADVPAKQSPMPIKAWGRAAHEAVVIDPSRTTVYLTEDAGSPNGLLYRWTAPAGVKLGAYIAKSLAPDAGTLEALSVLTADGSVLPDLAYVTSAEIGRPFKTQWAPVFDRTATDASLRNQFADGVVTRSKKLEGAWGDRRGLYFVASFAFGPNDLPANATKHDGQLWYYDYRYQTLTLKAYYPYNELLHTETPDWETTLGLSLDLAFDGPDNVHVSPYGPVILAEDGNTANHLLSWDPMYGTQAIARNRIVLEQSALGGNVYSEMTGPNFSPDGSLLFANIQEPGHTFAIRGPWRKYLSLES